MDKSKKWDRLKVQFVKCFTIENLHTHLVEEGFPTEADILGNKGVDGLRFVELSEKDFASWHLTPTQKSKIFDCKQSVLSTDTRSSSQTLGVKRFPLDRLEAHGTHSQATKKPVVFHPTGYLCMDAVKTKSTSPGCKLSPPPPAAKPSTIPKKMVATRSDSPSRNYVASDPKTAHHEQRSTWLSSDYIALDPVDTESNNFPSSLSKLLIKSPIDPRKMEKSALAESKPRPDQSPLAYRKGCPTTTLPFLQLKEINLTKAQSDTSIYKMPEETYEVPPTPDDPEEIYEAPPLIPVPSLSVQNTVLQHPQPLQPSWMGTNRKLPRPPPFDNNFEPSHLNACRKILNNYQDTDDEMDDNSLNLNDCDYYRNTDRKGAIALLNSLPNLTDGVFLLRKSYSGKSFLVLTVFYRRKFYNISIHRDDNDMFFCKAGSTGAEGEVVKFYTLEDFVKHYRQYPLKVKSQDGMVIIFLTESLPYNVF
ncbi:uncharacterized protein LOC126736576 isoform X2 [Anthonomus grandis grandis]|uniref:uncharacterized protein LOC126736576 isoform X2 n=1 Tax=Anthonomus grandis grandis TaxID=2921223 RepID=UPI002165D4B4|nr:uncharacterized protein LOC126736576 isoform X2 [Anthonomus grandis grandis]